ncbi:uncharacterized protein EDB91DRAFT_1244469 [Suillus paluster]|uniref:uncharacterized protein n=1 Tax=Suillus paluster TaxID=48578 RepID=UPI001B869762|nr:uncharacterized protein EDB91DRAFT_1244469 [Suillus paluster]KAG1749861.1 hypothetical protein EDB91DRAFT_1244469 [Suillus paluster]
MDMNDNNSPACQKLKMSEEPVPLTSSSHGRVSGKSWKAPKSATFRTQCSAGHRSKFEERMQKTTKDSAAKKLETELREEKHAEKQRRREITLERKSAAEERRRLEEDKAKVDPYYLGFAF